MPVVSEYSSFFESIAYMMQVTQKAEELLVNRRIFPILGIVVNNSDPENRRRIKIVDPLLGGKLESGWVNPIRVTQNSDPPLPQLYQTVLIFFINGDPEVSYYLPLINDTNPSREKEDSVLDESYRVEGNRTTIIDKNEELQVKGNLAIAVEGDSGETISGETTINNLDTLGQTVAGDADYRYEQNLHIEAGESILLTTDSGAFLSMSSTGYVVIQDAQGRRITLGGVGGFGQWDLNGFPLQIVNATSLTINGSEIATIGAVDNDGDVLVSKGW